ncbi:pyridoxamine 5'-phosphate oxidase family protein [Kitasatospora sp. NPDC048365]|uniref:pyridoxamine 5'-phosphate oxidase family protein n=1 Tax=Kitasatospora sp. NPDC048365 TaxID=3364050 RepID=UPI00371A9C5B
MSAAAHEHEHATRADPGDLGRRLALRREQLGLSRADVAARAGIAEGYLEYLETTPASPATGTVLALAAALGTTAADLLGGGLGVPPGGGGAAARPQLRHLGPWECWARLAPGGVGRVALTTPQGPLVLPVNYRVLDGTLLFRTGADGPLAAALGQRIAVEVDRIDEALSTGWSVLVRGTASRFDEPAAEAGPRRRHDPEPWAGGVRELWLQVRPTAVTGRAITADTPSEPG